MPFPTVLGLDEAEQPASADVAVARSGETSRQGLWRDELLKAEAGFFTLIQKKHFWQRFGKGPLDPVEFVLRVDNFLGAKRGADRLRREIITDPETMEVRKRIAITALPSMARID